MDCGSCSEEIVDMVKAHCNHFYIRANRCSAFYNDMFQLRGWKEKELSMFFGCFMQMHYHTLCFLLLSSFVWRLLFFSIASHVLFLKISIFVYSWCLLQECTVKF